MEHYVDQLAELGLVVIEKTDYITAKKDELYVDLRFHNGVFDHVQWYADKIFDYDEFLRRYANYTAYVAECKRYLAARGFIQVITPYTLGGVRVSFDAVNVYIKKLDTGAVYSFTIGDANFKIQLDTLMS